MFRTIVSQIEVVRQTRMLGSDGIDTLDSRQNTQFLTQVAHTDILLLHIAGRILDESGNLEVREAQPFCFQQDISRQLLNLVILLQDFGIIHDVLHPFDEPGIDLCQFVDTIDTIPFSNALAMAKIRRSVGLANS